MKKKVISILITLVILLPLKVLATGGFTVSPSSISMYVGESKTITITSNNAVGKLDISSSNTSVSTVSTSSLFIQTPSSSETITITAVSVGTSNISVVATSNFATMDEEILTGLTKTISVSVINKPVNNDNNNTNNNTNTNNNNNSSSNTTKNNKSTNNKIKDISIEGYTIEKVDDNNYKLTVPNNITSVNVKATSEDSKATITGTGSHEVNVGENKIEVIVKSESGVDNKITITVTRKDGYYLEDLKNIIKDTKDNINIIINKDTSLTEEELTLIKENKKEVTFNYYDENKILKYSWTIDGTKINKESKIDLNISDTTDKSKEIDKLANYANGIYVNFSHSGKLPENTKIKLFVGDKYNDNDLVNLYYYEEEDNKLSLITKNLKVTNGYIEFELEHCSEYFVTMSTISKEEITTSDNLNIFMIISIVELVMIIILVILLFLKKKKKVSSINQNEPKEQIKEPSEITTTDTNIDISSQSIVSNQVQSIPSQNIESKEQSTTYNN